MKPLTVPRTEYKRTKHSRRRKQVLDAAAALFAERGYFATTMQDIADRLGMRPGSLYHYFRSKEDALAEVCRISGLAFVDNMKAIIATDEPAATRIRDGIAAHVDSRWRDYLANFTLNRRNVPPATVPEMQQIARDYMAQWIKLIGEARAEGAVRKDLDAKTTATALVAMCNGVAAQAPASSPRIAEAIYTLFMAGAEAA